MGEASAGQTPDFVWVDEGDFRVVLELNLWEIDSLVRVVSHFKRLAEAMPSEAREPDSPYGLDAVLKTALDLCERAEAQSVAHVYTKRVKGSV